MRIAVDRANESTPESTARTRDDGPRAIAAAREKATPQLAPPPDLVALQRLIQGSRAQEPGIGGSPPPLRKMQQAFGRPAVQRKEGAETQAEPTGAGDLVTDITNAVEGAVKTLEKPKELWAAIEAQITTPTTTAPALGLDISALYAADLVKRMTDEKDKPAVWAAVKSKLLELEYGALTFGGYIEGKFPGFVQLRDVLLAKFGTLKQANAYYGHIVAAPFLKRSPPVHENMKAQLQLAAAKLDDLKTEMRKKLEASGKPKAQIDDAMSRAQTELDGAVIGGINIRYNRGASEPALSDHSFGWAIDVDDALNPMMAAKNTFPADLVAAFTGTDVPAELKKFGAAGEADDLLGPAMKLREASDAFKEVFASEEALEKGLVRYLSEVQRAPLPMVLLDQTRQPPVPLTAEQSKDMMSTLKKGGDMKRWLLALRRPPKAVWEPDHDYTRPPPPAAPLRSEEPVFTEYLAALAAPVLVRAHFVFKGTLDKKGNRIAPSVSGTASSVAAHGFINMPAMLVAALTGSDGGNLLWLVNQGRQDFMHFQLKPANQPKLT